MDLKDKILTVLKDGQHVNEHNAATVSIIAFRIYGEEYGKLKDKFDVNYELTKLLIELEKEGKVRDTLAPPSDKTVEKRIKTGRWIVID